MNMPRHSERTSEINVTCNVDLQAKEETITYWPGCGIAYNAEFSFINEDSTVNRPKIKRIKGFDSATKLTYTSESVPKDVTRYYVGIKEGNQMKIVPAEIYNMMPKIDSNDLQLQTDTTHIPLTAKEQNDEIKEKFGSRKTKRALQASRKFQIHFGEDDVDDIESEETSKEQQNSSGVQSIESNSAPVDILPPRNDSAINVGEVYNVDDIISEYEMDVISKYHEELIGEVKNNYAKNFITKNDDSKRKTMIIYLELLMQLLQLKYKDLVKKNPWDTMINEEVKNLIMEKYLFYQTNGAKSRYIITEQRKDQMLIHCIILSLMLNHYKPLNFEQVQKAFKIQTKQFTRIVEIIGCYVEVDRAKSNAKIITLKLPLNNISERVNKRRRRK